MVLLVLVDRIFWRSLSDFCKIRAVGFPESFVNSGSLALNFHVSCANSLIYSLNMIVDVPNGDWFGLWAFDSDAFTGCLGTCQT